MAIVINTATAIGPGYNVSWTGLTGPVPVDDFMSFGVRELATDSFLTAGFKLCRGATVGNCVIATTDYFGLADGPDKYVAPGTVVRLEWSQNHVGFSGVVASGVITTLTWDPTGALYTLIRHGLGGGIHSIDEIWNAVNRPFPLN